MGRIHNIEGKKNKMDSLRSNVFTKHARAISVAARQGGGNPDYNAALKLAIQKAKADNTSAVISLRYTDCVYNGGFYGSHVFSTPGPGEVRRRRVPGIRIHERRIGDHHRCPADR